jgi:predicted permease
MWPKIREWLFRLLNLLGRPTQLDRDFEDELAFHAAMREEEKISAGSNPAAARVEARRELGGIEKWKEALRDVRRPRALENFFADVNLAIRLLRKSPAFTLVALSTLALSIGANTAVFTLLDTLLLRPLPVPQAERLTSWRIEAHPPQFYFSYPIFRELEAPSKVFSGVYAFYKRELRTPGTTGTVAVHGVLASGEYFSVLRVHPQKGRLINPADDLAGAAPVVVISDDFWRTHFEGDPRVLGRRVRLNKVVFTVVGVMPAAFTGAEVGRRPDVFVPLALEPRVDAPLNMIAAGWRVWGLYVGARLRDGVTLSQANAALRVRSNNAIRTILPNPNFSFNGVKRSNLYVSAEAGATGFCDTRIYFRKPLIALMILVVMVLCVACLNLASLLMVRSASRERELATRSALGAPRSRLLQQLLTETLLLAPVGTAAGFGASLLFSRLLVTFLTRQGDSLQFDTAPDVRVFAFAASVAALSTVLIGIVPALRATGHSLQDRIKQAGVSLGGAERRHIWPRLLMASEIALASLLVTGAGLLGYSLVLLHDSPIGFDPHHLVMLPLDMTRLRLERKALLGTYQQFMDQLSRVHGLVNATYANVVPVSDSIDQGQIHTAGAPARGIRFNQVAPQYFATMRTPLIAGRTFRWSDTDETPRIAIVNQVAAERLFPHQDALDQQIYPGEKPVRIVGVVADAKYLNLREPAPPTIYLPMTQDLPPMQIFTVIVRYMGDPGRVILAADAILHKLAPEMPIPGALSMDEQISESLATERLMALLASFFAITALLITAIGLYGTLAYSTARRTGEIGIRMALGAQRQNIVRLILKENALLVVGGCVLGSLLSFACTRFIASLLYGVRSNSPAVLLGALCALLLVGLLASLLPAVRASCVDPMTAIRHE